MKKVNILDVKIDIVNQQQSIDLIDKWTKEKGSHRYIVTPNVEIIMAAQKDKEFKRVLNSADLAIPDSARLGWAVKLMGKQSLFLKLFIWPFFVFPKIVANDFPVTTGTDLMSSILGIYANSRLKLGFLGGSNNVTKRLIKKLKQQYPNIQIVFAQENIVVNKTGEVESGKEILSKLLKTEIDILFVAFGQVKQEKFMSKYIESSKTKVMIGVGGALDYLAGDVPRAPKLVRNLGFEWLFRLMNQPWRIKRFYSLVEFIFRVLTKAK